MKKIVVLSDSHANRAALSQLWGIFSESDFIIHLGDVSSDGGYIRSAFPDKTYVINGNCDPVKLGDDELTLDIEGVKIFACHGHLYSVKRTLEKLAERARELGCGIALYGHTHRAREDEISKVTLLNPGCLSRYAEKSYLYLVVNDGKAVAKIVPLG